MSMGKVGNWKGLNILKHWIYYSHFKAIVFFNTHKKQPRMMKTPSASINIKFLNLTDKHVLDYYVYCLLVFVCIFKLLLICFSCSLVSTPNPMSTLAKLLSYNWNKIDRLKEKQQVIMSNIMTLNF